MIEALIDGERRGKVMADLAGAGATEAGGPVDGAGRPVHRHHAQMCRLILDRVACLRRGRGLDEPIAALAAPWQRETGLLKTIPGFGDIVAWAWMAEIGPAPHQWFATCEKLASWVSLSPGNNVSAGKRRHGRTGDAGTYIKPMLVQAAWAAIRAGGGCRPATTGWSAAWAGTRTRPRRRRPSPRSRTPCSSRLPVLKSGAPYPGLGADFSRGGNRPPAARPGWNAS